MSKSHDKYRHGKRNHSRSKSPRRSLYSKEYDGTKDKSTIDLRDHKKDHGGKFEDPRSNTRGSKVNDDLNSTTIKQNWSDSKTDKDGKQNTLISKYRDYASNDGGLSQSFSQTADYWDFKREERDKISRRPKVSVWSDSPSSSELKLIEEEHRKFKEERGRENEEMEEEIKDAMEVSKKEHLDMIPMELEVKPPICIEESESDEDVIGPVIPPQIKAEHDLATETGRNYGYGDAMNKGEGAAMAAYIAQGKRIPRRGEIGLSSNEIIDYEKVGFVMSGSRNKRMETVRIRKENQVMTAEEQRLLLKHTDQERKEKEAIIMDQFQKLIQSKNSANNST
uniref:Nkap_C domain-containing protein n=1 Tax=Rhabditophanes sp. KR3021 TaxID=114890 RepID=A0AC35TJV6_9BILA